MFVGQSPVDRFGEGADVDTRYYTNSDSRYANLDPSWLTNPPNMDISESCTTPAGALKLRQVLDKVDKELLDHCSLAVSVWSCGRLSFIGDIMLYSDALKKSVKG